LGFEHQTWSATSNKSALTSKKRGLSSGELESCAKMEVNKNATIGDSGRLGDCQLLDTKTEGHNESSQRVAHVSLRQPPGFIVG